MMGSYQDRWYLGSLGALVGIIVAATALLLIGSSSTGAESPAQARATETTLVQATATPAADPATLDFARALDLLAVREALSGYYAEFGAFPSTDGALETLCDRADDAGCALREFNAELSFNDGKTPYWYASDGSLYTLVARAELEQPEGQSCPDELPDGLSSGPVMCMTGEGD